MLRDAVAAGEGALQTLMIRSDSTIKKSSTSEPSRLSALGADAGGGWL